MLLQTRQFLSAGQGNAAEIREAWKQNIRLLMGAASDVRATNASEALNHAAQAIGVTIERIGVFPAEGTENALLAAAAARECLTNLVRHAKGKRLQIHGTERENAWVITYLNDGMAPTAPIVEGKRLIRASRSNRGGGRRHDRGTRAAFLPDADIAQGKAGIQMKYKVMIVEDQTMPRELFELRIQASEHFEVAISIDNAAVADIYCLRFPVDLIMMDVVTRDGESGLDAAARIKRAFPQIKIIIVTSMPECSYLSRAREIGVESFWYKEEHRESLLDVMERTMNGESVYPDASPELTLGLASSYDFTERELTVLREITSGDTNQEIADRLNMSVATVKTHILNMLEKTGFRNRTELAVRARESGLVILNRKSGEL